MVIWVSTTASRNFSGLAAKPGAIRYISQGMASSATTVTKMLAAARVAMASAASTSATSSPSVSRLRE